LIDQSAREKGSVLGFTEQLMLQHTNCLKVIAMDTLFVVTINSSYCGDFSEFMCRVLCVCSVHTEELVLQDSAPPLSSWEHDIFFCLIALELGLLA